MFYKKRKVLYIPLLLLLGFISFRYVYGAYLTTNRDTKLPPDKVTYDLVVLDDYELLYETDTCEYYYREDRDVIAIVDKRTGYTWKTGLDVPFNADIEALVSDAKTKEEKKKVAIPLEDKMNSTFIGISNSLITVEYNEAESIKNISSASREGVESTLYTLNENKATRRLDINFKTLDLQLKVYVTFGENKITYDIKEDEITGLGKSKLLSINISPFLGASGGVTKLYNEETDMYDIKEAKYQIPGYIFVPDGSGSLIRFTDNNASFSYYIGDMYGKDHAQNTYYQSSLSDAIPLKDPVMPVFGIAHGNAQAAFVAYADKGDEYMEIVVRPEENLTYYNWAYPRFVVNSSYFQVYNNKGEGYFTLMKEPNQFDIRMTYEFLAGDGMDGTPKADYTGMALVYRKHLIDTGVLKESTTSKKDLPIRLDFIMSDSKKGIVGTDEVVVTTTKGIDRMLSSIEEEYGISNINSGLYGWQKKGEDLSKPYSLRYSNNIGSKRDFKELIEKYSSKGVDISYARDYVSINNEMISYYNNAVKHVNSWYLSLNKSEILPFNSPVTEFGYANSNRTAEWFLKHVKEFSSYVDSVTASGISNVLLSNYNREGKVSSVTDAISYYQEAMKKAKEYGVKVNLEQPNMYLWQYTDRYLKSPVGTSQYVFETDAVPFLQMVLHGTMEVYAPYSNFSFYTQSDILRMIDYNLAPSFILSEEPSYLLASTNSSDLYSTEFSQYKDLIHTVYDEVNEVLSSVSGYTWAKRDVIREGVILNTYEQGSDVKYVIINYTDETVTWNNSFIPALKAMVIE